MSRKHFHDIWLNTRKNFFLESGHPDYDEYRRLNSVVVETLSRTTGLREYLFDAFRKQKHVMNDPRITQLGIYLVENPDREPILWLKGERRDIYVDLRYDPVWMDEIPWDNKVYGELFIGWITKALSKLSAYPHFPSQLVEDALRSYRSADYTYKFEIGERTIPGTKLKGRLDGSMSCLYNIRTLTVSYRGKELFKKEVTKKDTIDVNFYRFFSRFWMEDDILFVQGLAPGDDDSEIDLRKYPAALEILRK